MTLPSVAIGRPLIAWLSLYAGQLCISRSTNSIIETGMAVSAAVRAERVRSGPPQAKPMPALTTRPITNSASTSGQPRMPALLAQSQK